ncbi:MAG: PKD domain-containing protein [Bacteroidia bacterium]|nr:PKD domain-containing protein [Bacteroidia bacterium]
MARIFYILSCLAFWSIPVYSQNTNISGVINHYVKVNQLGGGNCIDSLYVTSTAGFSVDDTVLLIQMKGATIDVSNTSNFGSVLNHGNSGNYEFSTVKSVSTGSLVLNTKLLNSYTATGSLQLVRVPSYTNVTVTGTLTAAPWNGQIGGVLALFASGSVTLNANIDVNGKGFRGGNASLNYYSAFFNSYAFNYNTGRGGEKGESIADIPSTLTAGRGACANGGGGGNDINTGAGGGGNHGTGGHGGNNYFSSTFLWGEGGMSLSSAINSNRIFLGGGGGGGHQNNSEGSDGEDGGGIVFVSASAIIGNGNQIRSQGNSVAIAAGIDGAGGGGGGGTIILDVSSFTGNLQLNVNGGKGGDQFYIPQCHGNGGGGGGGVILKSGLTGFPVNVTTSILGGVKGNGQCNGTIHDAVDGGVGLIKVAFNLNFSPVPSAAAGIDKTICEGESIQLGSLPQPGLNYLWNNGAGTLPNPVVSPSVTTTYILTVTSVGLCPLTATDTVTITVLPSALASFTYSFDCSGLAVTFTNTSPMLSNSYWNFGDGVLSSTMSPVHVFPDTGDYNVQLVISNSFGCIDTIIQNIHVGPSLDPVSSFSYSIVNCEQEVILTSTSLNDSTLIWDFGDGTTGNSPNVLHSFALPGTYTISLIALNSCGSDTFEVEITINPNSIPIAAFSLDTTWCSNIVSFYDSSLNTTGWFWDFGDGSSSSSQSPFHTYADSGSYDISLIASNSCGADTLTSQLNLMNFEMPNASFTYVEQLCDPSVSFVNLSEFYDSISWYLGDGTTSFDTSFIHLYQDAGSYNVLLIAENECGIDSLIQVVEINAIQQPEANFSFSLNECTKLVNFFDSSLNEFSWNWYFGDGGTSFEQNPIYEYQQSGFYEVMLIVNEGTICADTAQRTLIIDENSIAGLFIPNVFTPNNDGLNDLFELKYTELCDEISIKIYNRWGQQVFQSDNKQFKWDGKFKGKDVPDCVYYYIFKGKVSTRSGSITIIR